RGGFIRPKTIITILSDFINDARDQDSTKLAKILMEISKKSTFFNLFLLTRNDTLSYANKLKVLPMLEKNLTKEQYNLQKITDNIDLRSAIFKTGKSIEFIV